MALVSALWFPQNGGMKPSTLILSTLGLATAFEASSANRLVFDLGHGQTSVARQMPELGRKLGFEIEGLQGPLTADQET